jgi:hypothetical protein
MKSKKFVIFGAIVMVSGLVFHLQGQSIVGPESSFMYSNPQWTIYGIQILIAGVVIMIIGIVLNFIKRI